MKSFMAKFSPRTIILFLGIFTLEKGGGFGSGVSFASSVTKGTEEELIEAIENNNIESNYPATLIFA